MNYNTSLCHQLPWGEIDRNRRLEARFSLPHQPDISRAAKMLFRLLAVTATLAVTAEASAVQLTKANCKTTIHFFTVLFFYLHAPPTTSNCLRLTRSPLLTVSLPSISRSITRNSSRHRNHRFRQVGVCEIFSALVRPLQTHET